MDRDLVQDYLQRSGMDLAQAQSLSRIIADMEAQLATKEDVAMLKSDLTWRMIAVAGLFGTVVTILNSFIGS